jgi:NADH:ubiquinone oxidoreductase subunit 3 (subunit A)
MFLGLVTYLIFHKIAFKNIFKKNKKNTRESYGFYECGFRPRYEYSSKFDLNTYVICALAILYDIECVFLMVFFVNLHILSIIDIVLIIFYLSCFLVGFYFELSTKSII